MYMSDLEILAAKVDQARALCDGYATGSTRSGQCIEVTQALLAASWALRAATFTLRVAVKEVEKNGNPRTVPSSNAATGG